MAKLQHSSEKISQLSRDDLIERIRQLEFHVNQLKNVIAKGNGEKKHRKQYQSRPFDFSKHNKRHILLRISYLGWDYNGYVVQEDTNKTIENELFDAFVRTRLIESRETSNYHRCGRTDKGVSAFSQIISIDFRSSQSQGIGITTVEGAPTTDHEIDYVSMLNRVLPPEIRVIAWAPVGPEFSARFDCLQRLYKYFFPKGDLDITLMNEGAAKLVGIHDFRNLCKMDVANGVENFIRTVDEAYITVEGKDIEYTVEGEETGYTMCVFTVKSKAFLWHQIRCIVALLFLIGKKLEAPSVIDELFNMEVNPCKPQYTMASELPLSLYECDYEGVNWVYDTETVSKVVSHFQSQWAEHNIKTSMIRSMIRSLEPHVEPGLSHQGDQLVPDYRRTAAHRPLLSRVKCSSLEDRQEHYAKRRKLNKALNQTGEVQAGYDQVGEEWAGEAQAGEEQAGEVLARAGLAEESKPIDNQAAGDQSATQAKEKESVESTTTG